MSANEEDGTKPTRRKLLMAAGVVGVGGAASAVAWRLTREPPPPPTVQLDPKKDSGFYRRLGRTELMVSAVGIGAGSIDDPALIIRAVDSGVNLIDTSVCYGDSELVIRDALRRRPDIREKLIIATKWDVDRDWDKQRILASLDNSLDRLGVKKIDIMQLHWLGGGHMSGDDGFNRLDNTALYEAMDEAKRSGKVRFFGATSHAAARSAILQHAIDKGRFDMLLIKMNVLDHESADIPALLDKARKADVGVVVMKSQPSGGKMPPGFDESRWNVFQANLRWVLSQDVACVVHSGVGNEAEMQDAAIEAARAKLSMRQADDEAELLERYAVAMSPLYCRGCDDICSQACPADVAIAPVLQFAMYDRDYGWPERAKWHYGRLPPASRWSSICRDCDACSQACPYGVDAAARVRDARARLEPPFTS